MFSLLYLSKFSCLMVVQSLLRSSKFRQNARITLPAIMVTCTAEILLISSLIDVCILRRFQRRRRPDDESPRQKTILETLIREEGATHTTHPNPRLYPYLTRPVSDGPKPRTAHWAPPPPPPSSPHTHPVISFRIVMNREELRGRND